MNEQFNEVSTEVILTKKI